MSNYANNHYVPKWLLRNFRSADEKLYYFDKRSPEKPVIHRNANNIFSAEDLYTTVGEDGRRDVSLEKIHFDKLEQLFQPIVEKIIASVRKRELPRLSTTEKEVWDKFLTNMWNRSPDFHKRIFPNNAIEELLEDSISNLELYMGALKPAVKETLQNSEVRNRIKKNAFVESLWEEKDWTLQALARRGLGIAVPAQPSSSFIIGSFPVAKLTLPNRTSLLDPIVETWITISHDVAFDLSANHDPVLSRVSAS